MRVLFTLTLSFIHLASCTQPRATTAAALAQTQPPQSQRAANVTVEVGPPIDSHLSQWQMRTAAGDFQKTKPGIPLPTHAQATFDMEAGGGVEFRT